MVTLERSSLLVREMGGRLIGTLVAHCTDTNTMTFLSHPTVLHKAEECALSDSCSVDDAKLFLREVIHLESGCAAGTLVGHDICEDQDHLAMIVANLRAKVERGEASHTTLE
jgi:hypothetical protein